jgi:hypothetical protein
MLTKLRELTRRRAQGGARGGTRPFTARRRSIHATSPISSPTWTT